MPFQLKLKELVNISDNNYGNNYGGDLNCE